MKQIGLLTYYWLLLIGIICFTAATSTVDPGCQPDLDFSKIYPDDITVTWNKDCFNGDEAYDITVSSGDDDCPKTDYPCNESPCQLRFKELKCPFRLDACSNVEFTITGSIDTTSEIIKTAPDFGDADWNLNGTIDGSNLHVTWNAADADINDVNCSTEATVSATWPDQDTNITVSVFQLKPAQGSVDLTIDNCIMNDITITVIYMSDGVPTETKENAIITPGPCISTVETTPTSTTKGPKGAPLSDGEIVAIVFGVLGGVALIGSIIYCFIKNKLCFKK